MYIYECYLLFIIFLLYLYMIIIIIVITCNAYFSITVYVF